MKILYLNPETIPEEGSSEIIQFRLIKPLSDHLSKVMIDNGFKTDKRSFFTRILTDLFSHKITAGAASVTPSGTNGSEYMNRLIKENISLKEQAEINSRKIANIQVLQRENEKLKTENERLINDAHELSNQFALYTANKNTAGVTETANTPVTGLLQGVTAKNTDTLTDGVTPGVTGDVTPGVTGGVTPSGREGVTENTPADSRHSVSNRHPFLGTPSAVGNYRLPTYFDGKLIDHDKVVVSIEKSRIEPDSDPWDLLKKDGILADATPEELISGTDNSTPVTPAVIDLKSQHYQQAINELLAEIETLRQGKSDEDQGVFKLTREEMDDIQQILSSHTELGKAFTQLAQSEGALRIENDKLRRAIGKTLQQIHSDVRKYTGLDFELQSFIEVFKYFLENELEQ